MTSHMPKSFQEVGKERLERLQVSFLMSGWTDENSASHLICQAYPKFHMTNCLSQDMFAYCSKVKAFSSNAGARAAGEPGNPAPMTKARICSGAPRIRENWARAARACSLWFF